MEHTEGKLNIWHNGTNEGWMLLDDNDTVIARGIIVACVNACKGIETAELELNGVYSSKDYHGACDLAQRTIDERDKEREAKKELLKYIENNRKCGCSECQDEMDLIKQKAEGSDT
jgi:hypothetical protein